MSYPLEHTVGSHSDDRGGESDHPCDCQTSKTQAEKTIDKIKDGDEIHVVKVGDGFIISEELMLLMKLDSTSESRCIGNIYGVKVTVTPYLPYTHRESTTKLKKGEK